MRGREFLALFEQVAAKHLLFGDRRAIAWVWGWSYVESLVNPYAIRYEPNYRYLLNDPRPNSTEWIGQKTSWGLFQVMGAAARERGFEGRYLAELVEPWLNAEIAAQHLLWWMGRTDDRTWDGALARYNGGLYGNSRPPYRTQGYVDKVAAAAAEFERLE